MYVTTLPVSPKVTANFTSLLAPFVADLASRFLGSPLVIANNLTGRKYYGLDTKEIDDVSRWYHLNLGRLGICSYGEWIDTDQAYYGYLVNALEDLYSRKLIKRDIVVVFSCPCGVLELPEDALVSATYTSNTLFQIQEKGVRCSVCNSLAREIKTNVLKLVFPSTSPRMKFSSTPIAFSDELRKTFSAVFKNEIVISRIRQTPFQVDLKGEKYYLDVDFSWSLFLAFLESKLGPKCVLVGSSRMMLPLVRVACVSGIVCPDLNPHILFYPVTHIQSRREGKLRENTSVDEFLSLADPTVLRGFLACGLHWNRKEVVVDSEMMHWASISLRGVLENFIYSRPSTDSISLLPNVCSGTAVRSLFTKLRKGRELDNHDTLLLSLLI